MVQVVQAPNCLAKCQIIVIVPIIRIYISTHTNNRIKPWPKIHKIVVKYMVQEVVADIGIVLSLATGFCNHG